MLLAPAPTRPLTAPRHASPALLRERGIEHAMVSAGGDSRVSGCRPAEDRSPGRSWSVSIRHPRRPHEVVAVLPLQNRSISTSGDDELIDAAGRLHASGGPGALKLRSITDTSDWLAGSSLRAEARAHQDNWAVRATTLELAAAQTLPGGLLLDASLRSHRQGQALFYSDNAPSETRDVSRSRQLSACTSTGLGARLSHTWPGLPPGCGLVLSAGCERKRSRYPDFTDLRTQLPHAEDANVFQAGLSATF